VGDIDRSMSARRGPPGYTPRAPYQDAVQLTNKLADTGQVTCFDNHSTANCQSEGSSFYGQDAHYKSRPTAYRDNGDGTVKKFTPGGELLMTLGEANKPAAKMSGKPFSVPTHVGIDKKTGEFYVADGYSNARVHKYTPEGDYLFSWGESGTGEGQFNIVHNVETDNNGWVYIADRENHRIQVFSSDGIFETQWVNLSRAACIYIDTRGGRDLVYIGEYFAGISSNDTGTDLGPRVTVMTTDGEVLSKVGTEPYGSQTGRFFSPHGITVDSKGDIYVAEVSHSDYGSGWDIPQELRSMQKLVKV